MVASNNANAQVRTYRGTDNMSNGCGDNKYIWKNGLYGQSSPVGGASRHKSVTRLFLQEW
jgi:hypothetical protein